MLIYMRNERILCGIVMDQAPAVQGLVWTPGRNKAAHHCDIASHLTNM